MKNLALAVGSFFLMTAVSIADSPVSISTGKRFAMAPIGRTANIVLTVRIEEHEDNRELSVSCDGLDGGIYASSSKSLDGSEEREVFDISFSLTPATYNCEAVLERVVDGKKKEFKSSLEVTVK